MPVSLAASADRRRPHSVLLLTVVAMLCVLVPFIGWHQTWFGRRLTDEEIDRYLRDEQHPRNIQHALSQISDRIVHGESAGPWSSRLVALSRHPIPAIRATSAWVLGQDNRLLSFHIALVDLLRDPELMVRRNAALSLVRFGSPEGRAEIVKILRPWVIQAPQGGNLSINVYGAQKVEADALLGRLAPKQGRVTEIRSPFSGRVYTVLARDGWVASGTPLLSIDPDPDQKWEALRALYFVGQPEDLADIDRYRLGLTEVPRQIRQQAAITAQIIRTRAARPASP